MYKTCAVCGRKVYPGTGTYYGGRLLQMHRWTSEPEVFLKKHQKELAAKKVALFVCYGLATDKTKPQLAEKAKRKYLEEKADKYNLKPVALGLFGGVYNHNNMPWYAKRAMNADRPRVKAAYKGSEPGIYDTRDHGVIQAWAEQLAKTLNSSPRDGHA
jgi:menaquinone-dependent protoporphyrinogen IX oxidase